MVVHLFSLGLDTPVCSLGHAIAMLGSGVRCQCAFQFTSLKPPREMVLLMHIRLADPASSVIMWAIITRLCNANHGVAAAQISGVENAHVQSSFRTNGCSGLEHRTDQDRNKVNWTDWSFHLRMRRMQSDNHLFLLRVFSIMLSLLLLLRYLRSS